MNRLLFILLVLCGCSSTKTANSSDDHTSNDSRDRIVFLSMKIVKGDSLHPSSVTVLKTTTTNGVFKQRPGGESLKSGALNIEIYNNERLTSTTVIEHPLYKDIEYPDSTTMLSSKHVELPEAEFFVRLQLRGTSNRVRILESLPNHPSTELSIIDL